MSATCASNGIPGSCTDRDTRRGDWDLDTADSGAPVQFLFIQPPNVQERCTRWGRAAVLLTADAEGDADADAEMVVALDG